MNVALVHESLTRLGGAERVLAEMHRLYPEAPIYALLHESAVTKALFPGANLHFSFLRRFPEFLRKRERLFLPLLPVVPETFDLSRYDVVISSASAFAKGVVTRPGTMHICYCHSPTRYLWDWYPHVLEEFGGGTIKYGILSILLHYLRLWDAAASRRVDFFIANSKTTAGRIKKYYGRDSDVIYPPVNVKRFKPTKENKGYFLIVSRLSPYKRIDVAIHAFNKLELSLVIIGEGRDRERLQSIAGATIKFKGFVSDEKLPDYYAGARAIIFPGEDDFGIVPVEAMASGKPVIALRRGGAMETIVEGITGEFFDEPHEALLAEAVRGFMEKESSYDYLKIRERAELYSEEKFKEKLQKYVEEKWNEWQNR
ncbi:MAG: glycosyltransferase [bacterium]|nr:glycosyltransferase [bacterium]